MFNKENLNAFMKQAQKMQKKISSIKKKISLMEETGESGAGLVKVTINGLYNCKKIEIDISLLKKKEKEILEDLTTAAFNDAIRKINEKKKEKMSHVSNNMKFPPGFNLPF